MSKIRASVVVRLQGFGPVVFAMVWAVSGLLPSLVQGATGGIDSAFGARVFNEGSVVAMARQADGKVVVSGSFTSLNGVPRAGLARLQADGTIDSTFVPAPEILGRVETIAVQADGKILLGGDGHVSVNIPGTFQGTLSLARLNTDGSLDKTFIASSNVISRAVRALEVLADGRILVGGARVVFGSTTERSLCRVNAADASVDSSFATAGAGVLGTGVYDLQLQPDGKILAVGNFSTTLARLNADGSVDNTFQIGDGPKNGALDPFLFSVALQPDGKILIGGYFQTYNNTARIGVARLNTDGSLDTGFAPPTTQGPYFKVALQPNGQVLVGGDDGADNVESRVGKLRRLNTDGSNDNSFSPNPASSVYTFDVEGDGKILVGGRLTRVGGATRFGLARVNGSGSLDTTYTATAFSNGIVRDVAVQPDGKVVIGGDFVSVNGVLISNIARVNADGSFDTTFVSTGADRLVRAVAVQPDGKIVIGGEFLTYDGSNPNNLHARFVARLNPNGSRDTTFDPAIGNYVGAIAIQPDGRIVLGTYGGAFNLVRINANGTPDIPFITGAGNNTGFGEIFALALQPDGKILIGGNFSTYNDVSRSKVARINSDGSLDASFTQSGLPISTVRSLALQPDGKVIAAGQNSGTTINNKISGVARCSATGTFETVLDAGLNITSCGSINVEKVAVLSNGKIMFAGRYRDANCSSYAASTYRIHRVLADGSLDPAYIGGIGGNSEVYSFAVQPDGSVVGGGTFKSFNAVPCFGIVRLLNVQLQGSRLLNISTRMRVQTGERVLIGGFIVTGNDPKTVLLRAIGPSLTGFGVSGALADPTMELFDGAGNPIATNNDWTERRAEIETTNIPPRNNKESAVLATLMPGAYTAIVRGLADTTGIGLIEAYDLDQAADSQLANISTRGFVETGNNVMIGGLIIGGDGAANTRVVVRAIGPSLSAFGITGALSNPVLELKNSNGTTLISNDDWQQSQQAEIQATGLAPSHINESALVTSLPNGAFTAIVSGKDGGTGVALVEAYNVP